jgi:two-component system, sensor histidine kinase LadS
MYDTFYTFSLKTSFKLPRLATLGLLGWLCLLLAVAQPCTAQNSSGAAALDANDAQRPLKLSPALSALPAPQPVFEPASPSAPAALPRIELGAAQKRIAIDTLSEYWIDDSGQANILEVQARYGATAVFAPRLAAQRHQLDGKALWIRFDPQITDTRSHWFMDVAMATTDNVTLFWRDAAGQWVKLEAGDTLEHSRWPTQDRFPTFQLEANRATSSPYYLRIAHARAPFSAPLHIYRDTALVAQRQTAHFLLGAYFGLVLLISLACTMMAVVQRDRIYLPYLLYVLLLGASQASSTGIAGLYLWPQIPVWSNLAYFFLTALATAAGMWFVRCVATPHVYMPRLDKITLLVIAAQVVIACVDLALPSVLGFQLMNVLALCIVVLVYAVSWYGWTRGDITVRWIALGFLPVLLGVLPMLLRNLGLIDSGFWTQYGVTIGSAIEMPILLYGLLMRSSARREARVRTAGLPTHDALTGLSNTYDLLRHIHGAMTRALRYRQTYGLILVEPHNHSWFVKEHGNETSDRALMLMATRLRLIARDVDTAGRIDDNHFVLLIEGPCKQGAIAKAAAQIAASAMRPSDLLPVGASIKLRITCAIMPDPQALELGDDAKAQLDWLVHSSQSLEYEPRKNIRTLNF